MKKSNIMERLDKLRGVLGGWDAVSSALGMSRTQLFRIRSGDQKITDNHLLQIDALEKKSGITRSSTEILLRQMLADRMALILTEMHDDKVEFEKRTGLPFDTWVFDLNSPLPPCKELRRIAGLAEKTIGACLKEADEAMAEIEAAKNTINSAQDKLRNLLFYVNQRETAGLLKDDPLLKVIDAYENEK
jgi:hypothetical protein